MQHPDEGTIHAWLDGELPPEEARALESHVASCAPCAALVAEARGLVAASTRILGALDDVPGGVVPAATPPVGTAGAAGVTSILARRRSRRSPWRNPQFAAAAAVLVVVIGTLTVLRRGPELASPDAARVASQEATAGSRVELMDSAALAPSAASARAPGTTTPAAPPPAVGGVTTTGAQAKGAGTAVLPAAPVPQVSGVASDSVFRRERAANEADVRAKEAPVALANRGRSDSTVAADSLRKAVASADLRQQLAVPAESVVARERSRLAGEVQARLADRAAAPAAAAPGDRLAARDVTTLGLPLCYDLTRSATALEAGVPARLQLLEARGPLVGERILRLVALPGGGAAAGEWHWWLRSDGAFVLVRLGPNTTIAYEGPIVLSGAGDVRGVARRCDR